MRLWTLHPRHLDPRGLVALWREALLAQAVLLGKTRGYLRHPQLARFRAASRPLPAIAAYLHAVCDEAERRGYHFDRSRIAPAPRLRAPLFETRGQLGYEWAHLERKLRARAPLWHARLLASRPTPHPVFRLVPGPVREWERPAGPAARSRDSLERRRSRKPRRAKAAAEE